QGGFRTSCSTNCKKTYRLKTLSGLRTNLIYWRVLAFIRVYLRLTSFDPDSDTDGKQLKTAHQPLSGNRMDGTDLAHAFPRPG
ncbi:MAG TPA: hypothetical protein PLB62_12140, partial [Candidatus Sumerlaeota bacterium]|nr:hypothetical protein [Candidatus Sumerlaeota bacterium]